MESKKQAMHVNPIIRSDTHAAFSLCSTLTFGEYFGCYFFHTF